MNRYRHCVVAFALLALGLLGTVPARAQSLTEVTRSTWAGSVTLPSYVKMFIYVPTKLAAKPPIVVSAHACGSTASGQMGNIPKTKAAADANGFILILPDNTGQNCWDVGNPTSLKHDGGGDTQAVATMVKYALTKYSGDASRVYIFGGSSGGMMTQAMLAVYPDVFKAGHARAGVAAGCWADGYDFGQQWSGTCAAGSVSKTGQQWGDLVRSYYPGYTGHRPRVQLVQGGSDTTISSKNMAESIKEWTNVLGLSETSTSKDTGYNGEVSTYDRQFWKNACGFTVLESWVAPGQGHSMGYEETALLKFFGLDVAGDSDPETDCTGDGGVASTGGVSGSGGTTGAGGAGGASDGGSGAKDGGHDVGAPGSGGAQASGGSSGSGGAVGTGGSAAGTGGAAGGAGGSAAGTGGRSGSGGTPTSGGASGSGGTAGTGGTTGSGGSSAKGGSGGDSSGGTQGNGGAVSQGGNSGTGGSTPTPVGTTANGCGCALGSHADRSVSQMAVILLAALGLVIRRQRRTRR
jgi:poly(hydroxyalkanoate) depolymerase family esterase